MLLAGGIFHRPFAGHRQIVRAKERVKVRPRHVLVKILGNNLPLISRRRRSGN